MIDITIDGHLPEFKEDFVMQALSKAGDYQWHSVLQNFIAGGRPNKWPPLKSLGLPDAHLIESGALFESIQVLVGHDNGIPTAVIFTEGVPYAAIHQWGGVIHHPGSDSLQVWQGADGPVFSQHTRPHDITIPQRMYMMFQEEDVSAIAEVMGSTIFELIDASGQPLLQQGAAA